MARQEAGEPYFRIGVDEARKMLDQGNAVAIDVREPNEWVAGHIRGAIHIPVDDILARINELPGGKDLLFICAQGVRSGLACEMAAAMGVETKRLYNIEDGNGVWMKKGYPTDYGQ